MRPNKVFIGGSRRVIRLAENVMRRLDNIIEHKHHVLVGDAPGADKVVQKYLHELNYDLVTVFCSGESPRNNLGDWIIHRVYPPKTVSGFQFYAAKDREMAREADFGLMVWDSKSAGTVLNVLRLVRAGKVAVLINVPDNTTYNIKSIRQWDEFIAQCNAKLRADLRERATPDEWEPAILDGERDLTLRPPLVPQTAITSSEEEFATVLNHALGTGDASLVVEALGNIARARGMTQVAKETGLARESLYRSLVKGGNPEFVTVLKVLEAVGLHLEARKVNS